MKRALVLLLLLTVIFLFGCTQAPPSPQPTPTSTPFSTPQATPTVQITAIPTPTPRSSPYCGDGVPDPGEQCERGHECPAGSYCTINCTCTSFSTPIPTPTPAPTATPVLEASPTPGGCLVKHATTKIMQTDVFGERVVRGPLVLGIGDSIEASDVVLTLADVISQNGTLVAVYNLTVRGEPRDQVSAVKDERLPLQGTANYYLAIDDISPMLCSSPTPPPGNAITNCGIEIDARGDYVLDHDITGSDQYQRYLTDCIRFSSSAAGSSLDCRGHMVGTSGGTNGVFIGAPNVVVKNCRFSAFRVGVAISDAGTGSVVANNTFTGTWFTGVSVVSAHGARVLDNSMKSTGDYGIYIVEGGSHDIRGNNVTGSRYGIYIAGSVNNTVTGNRLVKNTNFGLYATAPNNIFANNTACLNAQDIYCENMETDLGGNVCAVSGHQTCSGTLNCTPCS